MDNYLEIELGKLISLWLSHRKIRGDRKLTTAQRKIELKPLDEKWCEVRNQLKYLKGEGKIIDVIIDENHIKYSKDHIKFPDHSFTLVRIVIEAWAVVIKYSILLNRSDLNYDQKIDQYSKLNIGSPFPCYGQCDVKSYPENYFYCRDFQGLEFFVQDIESANPSG